MVVCMVLTGVLLSIAQHADEDDGDGVESEEWLEGGSL